MTNQIQERSQLPLGYTAVQSKFTGSTWQVRSVSGLRVDDIAATEADAIEAAWVHRDRLEDMESDILDVGFGVYELPDGNVAVADPVDGPDGFFLVLPSWEAVVLEAHEYVSLLCEEAC